MFRPAVSWVQPGPREIYVGPDSRGAGLFSRVKCGYTSVSWGLNWKVGIHAVHRRYLANEGLKKATHFRLSEQIYFIALDGVADRSQNLLDQG